MVMATFSKSNGDLILRREFKDENDFMVYEDIESLRNNLAIQYNDNVQVKTDVVSTDMFKFTPNVPRY